jgi:SAM-dependent methyltransferase
MAVRHAYSQQELDALLTSVPRRVGWDFSRMKTLREPVPWEYDDVVARYVRRSDDVLDVGTGGGERLSRLAGLFSRGLGIDIDPEMVRLAEQQSAASNLNFRVCSARLETIAEPFPIILNRHAELDLGAIREHLKAGGYLITQQVGERNMACVRAALGLPEGRAAITPKRIESSGLQLVAFCEYDVEYVVLDIESLVFWLTGLDGLHADIDGAAAVASATALNKILAANVDERGFHTNEHRYLAIARAPRQS